MLHRVAGRRVEVMPLVGAEVREAVRARRRAGIVPVGHDDRRQAGVVEDGQERQALGAAHPCRGRQLPSASGPRERATRAPGRAAREL